MYFSLRSMVHIFFELLCLNGQLNNIEFSLIFDNF